MSEQGSRKSEIVVVPAWGARDNGKTFKITEWPAARADRWGMRMLLALKGTDAAIPANVQGLGMVGVAILGINAFLRADVDPDVLLPLLDELLDCVKIVRDPRALDRASGGPVATDIVSDDDIAEVRTRLWLRSEVLRIHTGFSAAEALSKLLSAIQIPAPASSIT